MSASPRRPPAEARMHAPLLDGGLVARHQIAAVVATGADFSTMVLLVELIGFSAPLAALCSALAGGGVNFAISRTWAFRHRHGGTFGSQALRYAAVSSCGAHFNTKPCILSHKSVRVNRVGSRDPERVTASRRWPDDVAHRQRVASTRRRRGRVTSCGQAFSMTRDTVHDFVFDRGRQALISTRSPILAVPSSSCA